MLSSWTSYVSYSSHKNNWMKCRLTLCCLERPLTDQQIWDAFDLHPASTVMTVFRHGAQHVNNIVVKHLSEWQQPLTRTPWLREHLPLLTNARHLYWKSSCVVNGQEASIVSSQNNTIILELPEGQRVFVHPVTHLISNRCVTYYPFTPACAQTITKLQGQNIKHLIIWLRSPLVPPGTAYV